MARRRQTTTDSMGRVRPATRRPFGTVKKLPSGNYRASYCGPDGATYAAPSTFTTATDADAWLAPIGSTIRNGTWRSPNVLQAERFGEYARTWVEHRRNSKGEPLAPKTRVQYDDAIRRGFALFGGMSLGDITAALVRKWHAERCTTSGESQAGAEARILRAILTTATRDNLIPANPVPSELCRSKSGVVTRIPTYEELGAILRHLGEHAPAIQLAVMIGAYGGLRLSEWRALRRSDITLDAEGHYVVRVERQAQHIDGAWVVDSTKGDDRRAVSLPEWVSAYMTSHLAGHVGPHGDDILFPSGGDGEFIDTAFRTAWDRARKAAGIPKNGRFYEVREHDLRHFYATELARAGASAVQIQDALGHADIRTSMVYVEPLRGATATLANKLAPPPAFDASNVIPITRTKIA